MVHNVRIAGEHYKRGDVVALPKERRKHFLANNWAIEVPAKVKPDIRKAINPLLDDVETR